MSSGSESKRAPFGEHPRGLLHLAVLAGLLTGVGEVLILALRKFVLDRLVFAPAETLWMAPVSDALIFLLCGLLLAVLSRLARGRITLARATGGFAGLALFTLCLHYGPLSRVAAVLLALGAAVQVARVSASHADALYRWSRRLLLPMGAVVALAGAGLEGYRRLESRRHAGTAPAHAPNVLLIILDTVRSLNLSLYGYARPTTPELERLASTGVRFEHAISPAPWTLPAHASIFTARWPHELSADWLRGLDERQATLAEVLAAHGFSTAGFAANTRYTSRESGLARGFGWYRDYPITPAQVLLSSVLSRFLLHSRYLERHWLRVRAEQINDGFLTWLDGRNPSRPFFVFLNYMDAHDPYQPPVPYAGRFGRPGDDRLLSALEEDTPARQWSPEVVQAAIGAYDASIAALDARLGELFHELGRRGVLDNTLVIITADHGEEFGEHGVFFHGNSLYRPSVEVPLILRWPGRVPSAAVLPGPVSTRDLAATILDLIGVEGEGPLLPGQSLARLWREGALPPATDTLLSEVSWSPQLPKHTPVSKGAMQSVVRDGGRLIRNGDGRYELYDFDRDVAERYDLVNDPAEQNRRSRLEAALAQTRKATPP